MEALCLHCGACCGAFEDPCEHLVILPEGKSHCNIYEHRFGPHQCVSGAAHFCVPIRQKIGHSWPGDERCGYKCHKPV